MMEPKKGSDAAIILEFKVQDMDDGERELSDTVKSALDQIEDKTYEMTLISKGMLAERI